MSAPDTIAPCTPICTATTTTSAPPAAMPDRAFAALAGEVAEVCDRHGVAVHLDADRERLESALWGFIHPDLAGTDADPYHPADDD